ncbi:metallophosphoesterase [Legionella jordanis]|uniref:3',5'-cyclic-nucleotide phosphodiesterase n=2 Tax=Legionella jordanis TaxID=456 RepID=A0A0W0V822_9GAMM|nr:metallophosphoesterase [Legionella jordanis]KTD16277.1 3',5'-cyclic-nucleotide phosphodiesterase [Legionella jordanis]RMX04509.1 metallophosphoesterase [Legionella jordanis]VEH12266.1 3',5'-cyclic-nucleotide phosphodiesterase [Legionella jordanis]
MKIMHISDLHFGMHLPLVMEAFQKELELLSPDVVIISGDLTQRAKVQQFIALQQFLLSVSTPILVVPGNHDVPLYNIFNRLFKPFKGYSHFVGKHFPSEFINDELAILGVNSVNPLRVKEGKLTSGTLQKIDDFFATQNKAINILFFHHNFDQIEDLHKPLENEEQFVSFLAGSKIDIVCTGHLHYANVGLIRKKNDRICLVLHAGTLSCSRKKDDWNSYFFLEKKGSSCCEVDWRVFKENSFESQKKYAINLKDHDLTLKAIHS